MSVSFENCVVAQGKYNNYRIGANICNAFAIGDIWTEDFYLIGIEPPDESMYPILTGNIYDSEGTLLFQLDRNVLKFNPGHCSKVTGNLIGYEIHDSAGKEIFAVETVFDESLGFVTSLRGNFYNRAGKLVFRGDAPEIEFLDKFAIGIAQNGATMMGTYSEEETQTLALCIATGGERWTIFRGVYVEQDISFDNAFIAPGTRFERCNITTSTGRFRTVGTVNVVGGSIDLIGAARAAYDLAITAQQSSRRP